MGGRSGGRVEVGTEIPSCKEESITESYIHSSSNRQCIMIENCWSLSRADCESKCRA